MQDSKIIRVVGLGSAVHLDRKDPFNPINRRISIIVMNKKTEEGLLKEGSQRMDVGTDTEATRAASGGGAATPKK
jgi:chemotaxis protein MotB